MSDAYQPIVQLQCERNGESKNAWADFASHRHRIGELVTQAVNILASNKCNSDNTLTVLGAGNCNDLNLSQLLSQFKLIQLIDIDRESVVQAVVRQVPNVDQRERLRIVAPYDFSGLHEIIAVHGFNVATINACERHAVEQPAHVVLSTCVLSQIVDTARLLAVGSSVDLVAIIQELRQRHLTEILSRLAPGGCGLLICDFCSALTWPELPLVPDREFPVAAAQQIQRRNFFTGLNPLVFQKLLTTDPRLQTQVENVKLHLPWRWQLGGKWFAVFALQFQRRASSDCSAPEQLNSSMTCTGGDP